MALFRLPYLLHLWLGTAHSVVFGQPLNANDSYGEDDYYVSCDEAFPPFKFEIKSLRRHYYDNQLNNQETHHFGYRRAFVRTSVTTLKSWKKSVHHHRTPQKR